MSNKAAFAVELSLNRKTGPCSVTYASQKSCNKACPFLGGGCYGNYGNMARHTNRVNQPVVDADEIAKQEADAIDDLSGRHPLRLHVVGDCLKDRQAQLLASAVSRYKARGAMYRTGSQPAWTFSHSTDEIERDSWGEISVLASCHNLEGVKAAHARGYASAMTVDSHDAMTVRSKSLTKGMIFLGDGFRGLGCPQQINGTKCIDCRLCFKDKKLHKKKIVILFALHGATRLARRALEAFNNA